MDDSRCEYLKHMTYLIDLFCPIVTGFDIQTDSSGFGCAGT